jgi:hypothetical protein
VPSALKQRSPAGGRWAGEKIHRIEKMNHCEVSILWKEAQWVKLATRLTMEIFGYILIVDSRQCARQQRGFR